MVCAVAQTCGETITIAKESQQADRHVTKDGHGLGRMFRAHPTGILAKVLVADPMQPIFDAPVAAHEGRQPLRVGLGGRQASDAEMHLGVRLAVAFIDHGAFNSKDLFQAGPNAVVA